MGSVFFQGKSLSRCPSGYTTCSEANKNSTQCISSAACESMLKQGKGKTNKSDSKYKKTDNEEMIEDQREEDEREELKIKEQKEKIRDVVENLRLGRIIDPSTGETIDYVKKGSANLIAAILINLVNGFSPEAIKGIPEGEELLEIGNILKNTDKNDLAKRKYVVEEFLGTEL